MLTPFELEVALNPNREWQPKIVTDFRKLLPGKKFEMVPWQKQSRNSCKEKLRSFEIFSFNNVNVG